MTVSSLEEAYRSLCEVQEYFETVGIHNPFDKSKYREVFTANTLGQQVFHTASAGSDAMKCGADAHDVDGRKCEYKSYTLKTEEGKFLWENFLNGKKLAFRGVYNNASTKEDVESYRDIRHFFTVWYGVTLLGIYECPNDVVIEQLMRRINRVRSYKSTNGNIVSVQVTVDSCVWVNRDFKFCNSLISLENKELTLQY